MIGTIIISIKDFTFRIYLVRLVVAPYMTRPLSERILSTAGGRDREKELYRAERFIENFYQD